MVRRLERAPGIVQGLRRADALRRREEREDHQDGRPGEAAAEQAPIHLAGRDDVLPRPALLQVDDVDPHEQHEHGEGEDHQVGVEVGERDRHIHDETAAVEQDGVPDPARPRERDGPEERGGPDGRAEEQHEHGGIVGSLAGVVALFAGALGSAAAFAATAALAGARAAAGSAA